MTARLIELREGVAGEIRSLARRELVLGRDPDCDWVFDDPRISREHARIEPEDGEHRLVDLNSRNGTRVNGDSLSASVVLRDGDLVELGGAFTLRYEQRPGSERARTLGLAVAASVGVLLAALGLYFALRSDPVMDEAVREARAALEASARGEATAARDGLSDAVALLYRAGRLDDVGRLHVREEGLRRIGRELGSEVDLVAAYRTAVERARARQVAAAPSQGPCRLENIAADALVACVRERAEQVLVGLWQDPAKVPDSFYERVHGQLAFLLRSNRAWVTGSLERGARLEPMLAAELRAAKVPPLLRYVAMIESGYNPNAKSGAGAGGLWQFMPATARRYGLTVDARVDERLDAAKSTRAAAHYLNDLAFEFGDEALLLAVASYNKGENGIRGALRKLDDPRTERSYWVLAERGLLPAETRDYVPRLIAAAVLGEAGVPPETALRAGGLESAAP